MVAVALRDESVRSVSGSENPVTGSEAVIVTGTVVLLLLAGVACEVIVSVGLPGAVVSTLMLLAFSELLLANAGSGRTSPEKPFITTFPKLRALVDV